MSRFIYKPDDPDAEPQVVYCCDRCGLWSDFSDYWWDAHKH